MSKNRVIFLDIGNTAVTYAFATPPSPLFGFGSCLHDNIPKIAKKNLSSGGNIRNHAVISCVVPKRKRKIASYLRTHCGAKIWLVGENLPLSVKNRYKKGSKPGIDRLVTLFGG